MVAFLSEAGAHRDYLRVLGGAAMRGSAGGMWRKGGFSGACGVPISGILAIFSVATSDRQLWLMETSI